MNIIHLYDVSYNIGKINKMYDISYKIIVEIWQGGLNMITYEKLFELLETKNKNKAWLRKNGLTPTAVDWLIKNKDVKISTINKLCNLLDCEPADILTYTKDENEGDT